MVTAVDDALFAPATIANPYPYFAQLRRETPVHWNEKYEVWVISRYEDLIWIARHPEVFSSQVFKNDPRPPYPEVDESDLGLYEYVRKYQAERFIQHDRPEHTDMRKVIHGYFTPKSMEYWRPMVQSAIKHLLDEAEEKGYMDVMADFATPLPVLVIAQMLGLPWQDREFMRKLAIKTLFLNRTEPGRLKTYVAGVKEMNEYLAPLVEERMANPGEDLLSVLVSGERSGVFTRDQVLGNANLLLVAGHETTINLICNGALSFIRHPDQWEVLKRGGGQELPPLIVRATEECLRYDAPVKSIQRIASEDVELGGKVIHKLDRVRWFISSANRDPEKFAEADRFDITRWPNQHVAFGSGVHHCLGATIARLEGQEAFKALAERFPSLHLEAPEEDLEYQPSINFRSLKSLPVSWN
jgi:cytochrome P450